MSLSRKNLTWAGIVALALVSLVVILNILDSQGDKVICNANYSSVDQDQERIILRLSNCEPVSGGETWVQAVTGMIMALAFMGLIAWCLWLAPFPKSSLAFPNIRTLIDRSDPAIIIASTAIVTILLLSLIASLF